MTDHNTTKRKGNKNWAGRSTCIAALAVVGKRIARAQCCIPDVLQELFRRDVPELGDEIEGCEEHQEQELAKKKVSERQRQRAHHIRSAQEQQHRKGRTGLKMGSTWPKLDHASMYTTFSGALAKAHSWYTEATALGI